MSNYGGQPQMSTANGSGGQGSRPKNTSSVPKGPRDWSAGLFDVFKDVNSMILAFAAPCVIYGKNQQKLKKKDGWVSDAAFWLCCIPLAPCIGGSERSSLRAKANIEGSFVNDMMVHACCIPCSVTQEEREIAVLEQQGML
ncbi:hypothetical protein HK102_003012, partial [Quaeritorhiza haematococci]